MKDRNSFKLFCLPALSLMLLPGASSLAENNKQPNMLVIMLDDMGYSDISINGGKDINTPNIDKLFKSGTTITNHYANSTVSSPTRASFLTGLYPDKAGVPGVIRTDKQNNWGYLLPDIKTLPGLLKRAGYYTAIIGKWHLGLEAPNIPNMRGFDYFKGFLGDMMDDYYEHLRHGNNYMRLNNHEIHPDKVHATDLFSDWAVDYIESQKNGKNPFFLFLSYNAPHSPVQPPDDWYQKVLSREKGIDSGRAKMVALMEHLDFGIGRVIEALHATGLDENTLIVFTNDNGGSLPHGATNDPLRGGKLDYYEGGIKVPTCMVWPGMITPGSKTPVLSLTMDLLPTLMDIAGVPVIHPIDGISLWPYIQGDDPGTSERVLFWWHRTGRFSGLSYYAVRKGPYKLVQNTPYEYPQLFNLEDDPLEKTPLSQSLPIFRELKHHLSQHIISTGHIPWQKH